MKINKEFAPVTIKLETQEEINSFLNLLYEHDKWSHGKSPFSMLSRGDQPESYKIRNYLMQALER